MDYERPALISDSLGVTEVETEVETPRRSTYHSSNLASFWLSHGIDDLRDLVVMSLDKIHTPLATMVV